MNPRALFSVLLRLALGCIVLLPVVLLPVGEARSSSCVTAAPFSDVPEAHPFCSEIGWAAGAGIAEGFADGTYRPTVSVTRQSMAAFLYRHAGEPPFTPPATPTFPDVGATHPFFAEIEWLVAEGIAEGFADATYRPAQVVNRQAMTAYLYRHSGASPASAGVHREFSDVSGTHPFHTEIEWMVEEGISTGYADGTFRPTAPVSRQSTAAFLYRLSGSLPVMVSGVVVSRLDENTAVGGALRVQWLALGPGEQGSGTFVGYIVDWWETAGGSASSPLGSVELPPSATEHKVYHLDNGVDYTFSVRGVNIAGEGDAGVGLPANPAARPADLGSVSATPGTESGGQTAVVSFAAPDDRGEPINEVKFRVNGGAPVTAAGVGIGAGTGQAVEFTVGPGTGTPLSNGAPAQIDVRVCNEVGATDDQRCTPWASAPSVVPYGAPSAPGTPSVERVGDGRTLRWSWSEPANNGAAITAYEVSVDGGGWQRQGGGDRNYEQTFGYSQPHSLRVRAINDGPVGEKISTPSGISSGSTTDPPPPGASISASVGPAMSVVGCEVNCNRFHVEARGLGASTNFTLERRWTGPGPEVWWTQSITTDASGDWSDNTQCMFGHGYSSWVTIAGVSSNVITR